MYRFQWSWDLKMCPYKRGVLILPASQLVKGLSRGVVSALSETAELAWGMGYSKNTVSS